MKLVLLGTKRKVKILIEKKFKKKVFFFRVVFLGWFFLVFNREIDLTNFNPNHRPTVRVFD